MTKTDKTSARFQLEMQESADDLRSIGAITDESYAKITLRDRNQLPPAPAALSGNDIRTMREQAKMSQAAFARCLNMTTGYVSQLERGVKRPSGPALVLLSVIQRKGIAAVL